MGTHTLVRRPCLAGRSACRSNFFPFIVVSPSCLLAFGYSREGPRGVSASRSSRSRHHPQLRFFACSGRLPSQVAGASSRGATAALESTLSQGDSEIIPKWMPAKPITGSSQKGSWKPSCINTWIVRPVSSAWATKQEQQGATKREATKPTPARKPITLEHPGTTPQGRQAPRSRPPCQNYLTSVARAIESHLEPEGGALSN